MLAITSFYLAILCTCLISKSKLSSIPKSPIDRVKWLADFGFKHFKATEKYYKTDPSNHELDEILSDKGFQLIFECKAKVKRRFKRSQILDLLHWAEIYIATKQAIERIFEVLFEHVSNAAPPYFDHYEHVRFELKRYLTKQACFGVRVINNGIELDGWEVTEDSKRIAFWLVRSLVILCNALCIKNISINARDFTKIQLAFKCHLSSVKFDNCSLLFTFDFARHFNFQCLIDLTHFQFSNCHSRNFISMFNTVPKEKLSNVNVSNNIFTKEEIHTLIAVLKEMKNLECLDISFSFPFKFDRPMFSDEILQLSHLNSLNVSGNLDLEAFFDKLESSEVTSWEHLNLSINGYKNSSHFNGKRFASNISKFPLLKTLNLSEMNIIFFSEITENLHRLKCLEELSFGKCYSRANYEELLAVIERDNLRVKLNSNGIWFFPRSIYHIPLLKRIDLTCFPPNTLPLENFPDQFDTTDLYIGLNEITTSEMEIYSKFKKLKLLKVFLSKATNFKCFEILLNNNSIERIEFEFWESFFQYGEVINLIRRCKFKAFSMKSYKTETPEFLTFLNSLTELEFWKEVEMFECISFSFKCTLFLLGNAQFTNLHSAVLKPLVGEAISSSVCLPSVRILQVEFKSSLELSFQSPQTDHLYEVIKIFPLLAELKVSNFNAIAIPYNISYLKNLRSLQIECSSLLGYLDLTNYLSQLPLLTSLVLKEYEGWSFDRMTYGKHMNFPTLIFVLIVSKKEEIKRQFTLQSTHPLPKN